VLEGVVIEDEEKELLKNIRLGYSNDSHRSESYIAFSLMLSWIEDYSLLPTSPRNYVIYW